MKLDLRINLMDSTSRWVQIRDGLMGLMLRGDLRTGSSVPSQREVARNLGVNPATVARAYQSLVRTGVFVIRRGQGTFVSESAAAFGKSARHRALRIEAMRFARSALAIGADMHESLQEIEASFRRLAPEESDRS